MWLLTASALAADLLVPGAYPSINDALSAANQGDRILLAAGTYCEDVIIDVDQLTIEGAGMGLSVIDGACAVGSGVVAVQINNGNAEVVLRDLTIDGDGDFTGLIVNGDATVIGERLALVDGLAWGSYQTGADSGGGARLNDFGSDLRCTECFVCGNTAYGDGAGIVAYGGSVDVERTVFAHNESFDAGGAVYVTLGADARLVNNTFYANEADYGSGLRVRLGATAFVLNNSFVDHRDGPAVDEEFLGGGITGGHNLFWGNDADQDPYQLFDSVYGDPMFVDAANDCDALDLRLMLGSAAIGAGDPFGVFEDIGAYPFDAPDSDGDGYDADVDCDDNNAYVHPYAVEICNGGVDDDCNGLADDDDGGVTGTSAWYDDDDDDGYGAGPSVQACEAPGGTVDDDTDCDDDDDGVHPNASELCNGVDDDCDLVADEGLPDADGDGVCDGIDLCDGDDALGDGDGDGYCADLDCADDDDTVSPAGQEVCGGGDEDCDGLIDDDDPDVQGQTTWYGDNDGDDFGGADRTAVACDPGEGWASVDGDCNDDEALAYPDADEYCGTGDYDCDGIPGDEDPDAIEVTWYYDGDDDGFGDATVSLESCDVVVGYAREAGDCDDDDGDAYPDAPEVCGDGVDQDCDGADEACPDTAGSTGDTGRPGTGSGGSGGTTGDTGSWSTGSNGSTGTNGSTGSNGTTDTGGASGTDPLPTSSDPKVDDEGLSSACGCQTSTPGPSVGLAVLALLGWRRRRVTPRV